MKKILIGAVAAAVLATSSSALSTEEFLNLNAKTACKALDDENLKEVIFTKDLQIFYKGDNASIGLINGKANALRSTEGDISIDFLKKFGLGVNKKITWETLILNFYKFETHLLNNDFNDLDLDDILFFFMNTYVEYNRNETMKRSNVDQFNSFLFLNKIKKIDFNIFMTFADFNNPSFNQFFKYIALKDFRSAAELIKRKNTEEAIFINFAGLKKSCDLYEEIKASRSEETKKWIKDSKIDEVMDIALISEEIIAKLFPKY